MRQDSSWYWIEDDLLYAKVMAKILTPEEMTDIQW